MVDFDTEAPRHREVGGDPRAPREGWRTVKLGEVAEVLLGKMLDQKKNRGKPMTFLNNVAVRWGGFDLSSLGEMPFEDDEIDRYQIKRGDIVVCEGGECGRCAIWNEDWPIQYQKALHRVRVKQGTDQRFLYYLFVDTFRSGKADAFITGSTIKHLPRQAFLDLCFSLPPLATQRKIAGVLGALDDKIELNRKMNTNLEAQAQALFKSWFVDFDPWGGKRPSGWREISLLDVAVLFDMKRVPLSSRQRASRRGPYPYYGATAVMDYVDEYLYEGVYLLMGEDGSVVRDNGLPFLQYVDGKFWVNNHAHVMQGSNGYTTEMLWCALSQTDISGLVTGAVQAKLSQGNMRKIAMPMLSADTQKSFGHMIKPMFEKVLANARESRKLAELRDALLPKLMSGELEVGA